MARSRNPLELEPPDEPLERHVEELGEEVVKTISWKEGDRRRSKRVVLPPELADPQRLAKAARSEAVYQASVAADLAPKGPALLSFIRKQGGILEPTPDEHPLSGELRHTLETLQGTRTRGILKRRGKGISLRRMSERVAEAGYDHERDDQAELLQMVETEARLGPTYFPRYANPRELPELVYLGGGDWVDFLPSGARSRAQRLDLRGAEWFLFCDFDGEALYLLRPSSLHFEPGDQEDLSGMYERWHGVPGASGVVMRFPASFVLRPRRMGRAVRIGYAFQTPECAAEELRWHPFGEESGELPDLVELNPGRAYAIQGGAFQVTERGIVD